MKKQGQKKGFTIIEVVLVLAIAGLIFLMVFVALPALQRSQRDTQRREDMARFMSQLTQYQANNAGQVPAASKDGYNKFITDYLRVGGDEFKDPNGKDYTIKGVTACIASKCNQASASGDFNSGNISVYTNATCSGENPKYEAAERKIAITYKFEGAGTYCAHN